MLAGLIIPYFLNVDRYRASISTLISEQTGRRVTLGMIRARMLPQVGFDVAGFHMDNPPGFVAGEFVAADHVRGTFAFWPLVLHHELRLTSLELVRPKLVLLQKSSGENNYTFSTSSSARATSRRLQPKYVRANFTAALPQQGDDVPPPNSVLQVDELILRDATVVYGSVDATGHATPIVQSSGFNATLRHMQLQPLVIRDLASRRQFERCTRDARQLERSHHISQRQRDLAKRRSGIHIFRRFRQSRASEWHCLRARRHTRHGKIQSAKRRRKHRFAGSRRAHGKVNREHRKYSRAGGRQTHLAASERPAREPRASPPAPAATEILAQGHLDAKKIHWGVYVAGPASADLRFYSDRVEMWPITVRFMGGSLQASARTDSRQTPQRFAVNLEARNLSMEQLLGATPSLRGKFAGTGELDLQVFGSLVSAWQRSLTGKGQFAVRNGRISGFNLSGVAQSVANLAGVSGNTTFTAITGDLDINKEQISSRDIHLDSSLGTLDLKGSSGLDTVLDYDGQIVPQFASAASGGSGNSIADVIGRALSKNGVKITVPFTLHGTLQHPEILPGHGGLTFPAPAASHETGAGLSYPQSVPAAGATNEIGAPHQAASTTR